jgi:hypothetical protein
MLHCRSTANRETSYRSPIRTADAGVLACLIGVEQAHIQLEQQQEQQQTRAARLSWEVGQG